MMQLGDEPCRSLIAAGVECNGPAQRTRDLLAAERASTETRLSALERDFDGIVESSASAATDDEHDPEGGTSAFERQHVAALISQAKDQLAEIAKALDRLDAGSYGRCQQCRRAIAAERLAARPAASTCIRCAAAARR
jgi:RNA polymerase-binding transcription factor DksA